MKCSLIVAVDEQFGIGKDNDLMWHLPEDMLFFKNTTLNQVVILGRKNYESIPSRFRPLPKRLNIVISRNIKYPCPGALLTTDLFEAIRLGQIEKPGAKCYIIGGGEIYNWALKEDVINEMFITHVHHTFKADTFFPTFDIKKWSSEVITEKKADEKNSFAFTIIRYWK